MAINKKRSVKYVQNLCCFVSRLTDTQECLESSLIEKENTLAQTSEKLELISSLRESLADKETQLKDVSDKLLYSEHNVSGHSQGAGMHCVCIDMDVDNDIRFFFPHHSSWKFPESPVNLKNSLSNSKQRS